MIFGSSLVVCSAHAPLLTLTSSFLAWQLSVASRDVRLALVSAGDEDSEVKTVPAGATLYYDVELVRIIRP